MTTINENLISLHDAYLEQITNDIRLRLIASNGSSREEVEALMAERRRIEADIHDLARNIGEQDNNAARGGAYLTFIKSAVGREAEIAKADYDILLRQTQAKSNNAHNLVRGRRMESMNGVRFYRSHHRRH
jgi:hypothetical protein